MKRIGDISHGAAATVEGLKCLEWMGEKTLGMGYNYRVNMSDAGLLATLDELYAILSLCYSTVFLTLSPHMFKDVTVVCVQISSNYQTLLRWQFHFKELLPVYM